MMKSRLRVWRLPIPRKPYFWANNTRYGIPTLLGGRAPTRPSQTKGSFPTKGITPRRTQSTANCFFLFPRLLEGSNPSILVLNARNQSCGFVVFGNHPRFSQEPNGRLFRGVISICHRKKLVYDLLAWRMDCNKRWCATGTKCNDGVCKFSHNSKTARVQKNFHFGSSSNVPHRILARQQDKNNNSKK